MLNTVDYYEIIKATINYHYINEIEDATQVTELSVDKGAQSSFNIQYRSGIGTTRILIQNNIRTTVFDFNQSYIKDNLSKDDTYFEVPVDDNFIQGLHPNKRIPPYMDRIGYAYLENSVQPLQNNSKLLEELISKQENWKIQEKTIYLNRACLLINANITLYTHNIITQAQILVDEETGLILKSELYDSNNMLSNSTIVTELKINEQIPAHTFTLDLTNLTEIKSDN